MSKRVKKVFTNHEQVIHLWANQSQEEARCKNVFFHGKSCWSYGTHYELGRIVKFNGVDVALINAAGYSVTTSKHISSAYWACHGLMPVFKVDSSSKLGSVEAGVRARQSELVDAFFAIFKSRPGRYNYAQKLFSKESKDYGLYHDITQFNASVTKLGLKQYRLDVDQFNVDLWDEAALYLTARYKEATSPEALKLKEAAALKRNATKIASWRAGTSNSTGMARGGLALIRVKGDTLQTSHGASVPLREAVMLYAAIKQGKSKTGDRVGHFKFNQATADIIRIGCHTFSMSEADLVLGKFLTDSGSWSIPADSNVIQLKREA